MTMLNLTKDVKGFNTFGRVPADLKYSASLTTSSDQSVTVPNTAVKWLAIFSYEPGASVWVAIGTAASAPVGATFAATSSELNPVAYELNSGEVIHFLTSDVSANVGVSFYVLQQ